MWLDATLAYLHFAAIIVLFSFLTVQAVLLRTTPDERVVRLLGRSDIWAAAAAGATLVTGFSAPAWARRAATSTSTPGRST
jgi:uncharacterized membrane protein